MTKLVRTALFALALVGCADANDAIKAKEVQANLESSLAIGASRNEVEAVLGRLNIDHSYDKYASRYQGIIRNAGGPMDHAIVVYVYMNQDGKLTRVEAHDSYVGP